MGRPPTTSDRTLGTDLTEDAPTTLDARGPTEPDPPDLPPRYQHRRVVGRGSMGIVLVAWDTVLRREVAIKVLRGAAPRERFLHEARVTGRLEHPAIVPVHDAGETLDGSAYYVMRLVRGRSLQEALDACQGPGERLSLLDALVEVARGMAYAHARGVVHRDLKPENVMLGPFGEVHLVDWGLALVLDVADPEVGDLASEAERGRLLGTPLYMSPEQARGEPPDARSDVWALGMMLRLLLTGSLPWRSDTALGIVKEVRAGPPPPVVTHAPSAPPELAAIAERATRHAAKDRYPDAGAMAAELQRWRAGRRVSAYHYSPREELSLFFRQYRRTVQGAGLVVALLLLGVLLVGRESARARRAEQATAEANTRLEAHLVDAWAEQSVRLSDAGDGRAALAYAAAALEHRPRDPALRGVVARWLAALPVVREATVATVPEVPCHVLEVRGTDVWCLGPGGAWHTTDGRLAWYRADLGGQTRLDLVGDRLGVGGLRWGVVVSASDGHDLAPPLAGARALVFPPGDPDHLIVVDQRELTRRTWPDLEVVATGETGSIISGYQVHGDTFVVSTAAGWVYLFDLATLATRRLALTEPRLAMYDASFSPDGLRAVSSESTRGVAVWGWQDLVARPLEGVPDTVDRVGWSADGGHLWWADRRGHGFHLLDADAPGPGALVGQPGAPSSPGFDEGGAMYLVTGDRLDRYRLGTGPSRTLEGGLGWMQVLGPDRVAVGVGDGSVQVVAPSTLEVVERRGSGANATAGMGMAPLADGSWLVARNDVLVRVAADGATTLVAPARGVVFPGAAPGEAVWLVGTTATFLSAGGERSLVVPAPDEVGSVTFGGGELRYASGGAWFRVGPDGAGPLVAPAGASRVERSADGALLAWSVGTDLVFTGPDGVETARCPLAGRAAKVEWLSPDRVALAVDFDVRVLRTDCSSVMALLRHRSRPHTLRRVGDWLVSSHWDGELWRTWLPALDLDPEELTAQVAERTGWAPIGE